MGTEGPVWETLFYRKPLLQKAFSPVSIIFKKYLIAHGNSGSNTGVLNLFLAMYPFSFPIDEHVPLQQVSMYSFSISTDARVP